MKSNYKRIGDYIELVDVRNKELKVTTLLGLSITKQFIPSVANTVGTNMRNYKIIKKNQFACSIMQVRRDKKMPVALLKDLDEAVISQAYPVFEINKPDELLPYYLMMWFTRAEFDRHAEFLAVGGVRGSLEWEDFLDMTLPVPSLEKQQEIVNDYNTVQERIAINEQLNTALEATAQALYKHWFVDFEFPVSLGYIEHSRYAVKDQRLDLNQKGYKSSGGQLVYNEELDMEIPEGWEVYNLIDLVSYGNQRIEVSKLTIDNYISTENMLPNRLGITQSSGLPSAISLNRYIEDDILISNIRPYFKKIWLADKSGGNSNDILCFRLNDATRLMYVYETLKSDAFFDYVMLGAKGTKMPRGDKKWIKDFKILNPSKYILQNFEASCFKIKEEIKSNRKANSSLFELSNILLSKMATVMDNKDIKQPA